MTFPTHPALVMSLALAPGSLYAQVDARMLRQPDVSETQIAFVYAGDVWVASRTGGTAQRLSTPPGEESFPRFSPDGGRIAFNSNYDGNTDIYVMPASGGDVVRVTHHPWTDRMLDWYADGASLLYLSPMGSGILRYGQFYSTSAQGGMPQKLPVPYGEFGTVSPDGTVLAYTPQSRTFRTWKRYRGGWAADIWLFDLETLESRNITAHPANDEHPMWHGRTLYFLSDRGPNQRYNIWAYDLDTEAVRQVTQFEEFDIHFPAIGPSDIVFELGGRLYLMDLATEQARPVDVHVVTDRATLRPRVEQVSGLIQNASLSPSGQRTVFEARGELFTVPAEHGPILNLTRSSGVAERYAAWSPDGQDVAFWSDRSGEYELTLRSSQGLGTEERLTSLGAGYRFRPYWSPDSRKLAFIDERSVLRVYDRDTRRTVVVDEGLWQGHGALENFTVSWSSDGRWFAFARPLQNLNRAIFLFDTQTGERHQVSSGFYMDWGPEFDPDGDYLYFFSARNFDLTFGDFDWTWIHMNATNLLAVPLRDDVPSPVTPRSDAEPRGHEDESGKAEQGDTAGVEITIQDFERRAVVLPPDPGNFGPMHAAPRRVVYLRDPRTGSGDDESTLMYYDLSEREEQTVIDNVDWFTLSADGKKALVRRNGQYAIVEVKSEQSFGTALRTAELEMTVDPQEEWGQLFSDAWRFQRDFFYDSTMHGVDWDAMRDRYRRLLGHAVTRWDVNFVIGEMIGELNSSHTYRSGGDTESAARRSVGMLGVDWTLEHGTYRIARIIEGASWDAVSRSPLAEPGVGISEGDYVLAVNGVPLNVSKDPWASFQGLAGRTVALTVNDKPTVVGAREVLVDARSDEGNVRYRAWVEVNRRHVEEATSGRIGYIHVPNTGTRGHNELMRMFLAQIDKEGLIIDERFNSGGFLPDRMIELLGRSPLNFQARRYGQDATWPIVAVNGPKVMLINGWAGSGGDAFPEFFRKAQVGPIIGTRTWGGRIGLTGAPDLIDGGSLSVPTYRNYDPGGDWFAEGHGVEPDIEVPEDPTQLARGVDPQLERAVQEVLKLLELNPPVQPKRPAAENRSRR